VTRSGKKWIRADRGGTIGQNVFFGTYQHTIDAKGRTSLPAKFREALASAGEPKVVLVRSPHSRSVLALTYSRWSEARQRMVAASPFDVRAQRTIHKIFSSAHEVDLDVHGRVLVPPALREWAGLSKEVVWVGMGGSVHLWDRAAYERSMEEELPEGEVVDFLKA
jgi:MraZ protein